MKNEPQQNCISPNGKYNLLFGKVLEYSMGGAYACPIYLHALGENIITLHAMCSDKPLWNNESTIVYFPVWFSNDKVRLKQCVAKYDVVNKKMSIYEKLFDNIELNKLEDDTLIILDYLQNEILFDIAKEKIAIDKY